LILLYNYMTILSRHAVRSTANPQATEEAERCTVFAQKLANMQASWVCLKLQTKLIGCADPALLLCDNAF